MKSANYNCTRKRRKRNILGSSKASHGFYVDGVSGEQRISGYFVVMPEYSSGQRRLQMAYFQGE
jgi:hypothetical protein